LQVFLCIKGLNVGRKVKPDIIYAHSLTSVFPAYLASLFLKTKFIVRVYGVRHLYWSWQSLWLRMKECRDYLAFKVPADYFIITDDGSFGNLLAGKLGVPDNKIKYWRNGLVQDIQDEYPHAKEDICNHLHIDPSARIIASTCRLIPDYGVEKLVRALIDVFKKQPDCVCIIAGSGPERKRLEEFARKNNIASRIFFMGIVDRDMIKKILYASDIFVFLPDHYNCTNTMWEAMAARRCIVTSENDAVKEVLTSGKDSMLIPSDNIDSLAGILDKLLRNKRLRNELGENARIRAQQVLEPWSKRIEKEAELVEKLVEERR
jgi:glycosyltransferase involved in cell wall biosynthesis